MSSNSHLKRVLDLSGIDTEKTEAEVTRYTSFLSEALHPKPDAGDPQNQNIRRIRIWSSHPEVQTWWKAEETNQQGLDPHTVRHYFMLTCDKPANLVNGMNRDLLAMGLPALENYENALPDVWGNDYCLDLNHRIARVELESVVRALIRFSAKHSVDYIGWEAHPVIRFVDDQLHMFYPIPTTLRVADDGSLFIDTEESISFYFWEGDKQEFVHSCWAHSVKRCGIKLINPHCP